MWITVDVEVEELANELSRHCSREQAMEFVKTLDLMISESSFTEELIKNLINSMKHDFSSDESLDKMNKAIKLLEEAFGD